jgi:hypothetical protein
MSTVTAIAAASVFSSKAEALAHTERLNASIDETLDLIFAAWRGEIWTHLDDVADWTSYVERYAPRIKTLKLPVVERQAIVKKWAAAGMPQRDVARGVNVSNGTAASDWLKVVPADPDARSRSKDGSSRARRVLKAVPEPTVKVTFRDRIVAAIEASGERGMTRKELCRKFKADGGAVSGALTPLHKTGRLIRTTDVREDCYAYVTPKPVEVSA